MSMYNEVDKILEADEVDYVVSDLHLNHKNIIKHCRGDDFEYSDRGLEEMNQTLIDNWNEEVDGSDTVLYLGDFAWYDGRGRNDQEKVDELWNSLNGDKIFVKGDHDKVIPSAAENDVYSALIRDHENDVEYLATHFPGDSPDDLPGRGMPQEFVDNTPEDYGERFNGFVIHGHHHNNWPDLYPQFNLDRGTVNASVELNDYKPLSFDEILETTQRRKNLEV